MFNGMSGTDLIRWGEPVCWIGFLVFFFGSMLMPTHFGMIFMASIGFVCAVNAIVISFGYRGEWFAGMTEEQIKFKLLYYNVLALMGAIWNIYGAAHRQP